MSRILWLAAALALVSASAEAADGQGRYAAHGLGRTPCKHFVEVCEKGSDECKLTGTWIAGYLTAFNALNKDTFDILPWQPPELVAQGAFNLCKANPDAALVEAVTQVVRVLYPQRVQGASERVKIGDGKDTVYLYKDTIKDVQEQLIKTGHLKGKADGSYGPGTKAAIEAFQQDKGLPTTGVPDQRTLVALFYGAPADAQGQAAPQPGKPQATPSQSQQGGGSAAQPAPKLDLRLSPQQ
ncbi:peptidoglycan-binding domain-containing protein [Benzoatithermus flavus]|uniref:Peptidoglycan-binding domain-containing protein n=1 Tax=Benzoatithermus flavus TaxID=3108223 RepID=A0ABU8XQW2_9PROT